MAGLCGVLGYVLGLLVVSFLAADPVETELRARFETDSAALELALALYARSGTIVSTIPEAEDFDGGYRGIIRIVPQLPVGPERRHLEYVVATLAYYDEFFAAVEKAAGKAPRYRWQNLKLQFFKSLKRRTPAAFASRWTVSYNVNGTLNGSEKQVKDLMFHELFHLNDADHGGWTTKALGFTHASIRVRCGTKVDCLAPFAPDPLIVRGGTYYSFMPGNGPEEYGADLALRYFREQRDALAGKPVKKPFKCGPPENARVWKELVDEFFAGADAVPACAK
ncbi:MAG: hypothetical protein JNK82_20240 [Myxococcaceae bacterium]|nr:hypothetical protein [Myxococcaceae bacterium]